MSKKVSEMTADERKEVIGKIAECIKKHGLESEVKVKTTRETVCDMKKADIDDNFMIVVDKMFPPEKKETVDAFKEDVTKAVEGYEGVQIKVGVQLGPGCQYDPIKDVTSIHNFDKVTLEHKQGEVWLIDFWATWCPPCQGPMAHNQEMLTKREADWGDKVKIIGISIDQTAEMVVSHVKAKGWEKVTHYHRAQSDCSKQYNVSGVPNVMLIDTNGKIVFKGHPASRPDLEADFDTLLKGEAITGPGTESLGAPKGEDASGKELDAVACLESIDKFKESAGTDLSGNEEVKKHVNNMPRSFCVMVYEETYDVATEKSLVDWKNYRVLVGKQEAIDACKAAIEAKVSGEFEVILRE